MQHEDNGHEPATWQTYLKQLLRDRDSRVRERLIERSRLGLITFQRWANGVSRPREDNMLLLLKLLPSEHYEPFARLVAIDYPALSPDGPLVLEPENEGLPAEFYVRSLQVLATTPLPMGHQIVRDLLFRQAFEQLDAERVGLSLSLACCVPPRPGGQISSLREVGGLSTPPWPPDLTEKTMFLGAESLVGHTLTTFHPNVINSRRDVTLVPANWTKYEQSSATFPLCQDSRLLARFQCPRRLFYSELHFAVYANCSTCYLDL